MKGLILAAGYATRLHPLTKDKSKCLIDINGRPIIDYILDNIVQSKMISNIYVVTNEKFYLDFEHWAKQKKLNSLEVISDGSTSNEDRLGAPRDIALVIKEKHIEDDLLVIAGDNLFDFKIKNFLRFSMKKNSCCIAAKKFKNKSELSGKFGVIEIDKDNKIINFEEKPKDPKTNIAATACYFFKREDLPIILEYAENNSVDNAGELIKHLVFSRVVYAYIFRGKWFDIGSFEDLGRARKEFLI